MPTLKLLLFHVMILQPFPPPAAAASANANALAGWMANASHSSSVQSAAIAASASASPLPVPQNQGQINVFIVVGILAAGYLMVLKKSSFNEGHFLFFIFPLRNYNHVKRIFSDISRVISFVFLLSVNYGCGDNGVMKGSRGTLGLGFRFSLNLIYNFKMDILFSLVLSCLDMDLSVFKIISKECLNTGN